MRPRRAPRAQQPRAGPAAAATTTIITIMSSFSESALEKKLSELSNSQQSVQTLSLWLIHHRKHAGPIVSVWHRELRKGGRGAGSGAGQREGNRGWGWGRGLPRGVRGALG